MFFAVLLILCVCGVFYFSYKGLEEESISLFGKYQFLLAQEGAKSFFNFLERVYGDVNWLSKFLSQIKEDAWTPFIHEAWEKLKEEERGIVKEMFLYGRGRKIILPSKAGKSLEKEADFFYAQILNGSLEVPGLFTLTTDEGLRRILLLSTFSGKEGEKYLLGVTLGTEALYLKFFHFLRLGKGTQVLVVDKKGKIILSPLYVNQSISKIEAIESQILPFGGSIKKGRIIIRERKEFLPPVSIIAVIPIHFLEQRLEIIVTTPEEEAKVIPLSVFKFSLSFTFIVIGFIILSFYSFLDRMRLAEKHYQMSITDGLTGLYNHHCFYNVLPKEIKRAERYSRPLSLIMIDLDGFKKYNDTHGHLEGDKVLQEVGGVLRKALREGVDIIFRYGGDEFAVILPETGLEEAKKVAERIKKIFGEKDRFGFSLSMGIAEYRKGWSVEDFVREADRLLYKAKRKGGNTYVWEEE